MKTAESGPGAVDAAAIEAFLAQLSRAPDLDAPELQAYDAADILLLQTAEAELRELQPGKLVVIGDGHGALTLGAAALLNVRGIRTHQDPLLGERALRNNADRLGLADTFTHHELDAQLLEGASIVLVQLPRGLDALDEIAQAIARWTAPNVRVFAGGRVKHMTRAMNDVLARSFDEVQAGLGWRKARVLTASSPRRPAASSFPRWAGDPDLDFELAAYGATFGGPTLDHGSRLLLATFAQFPSDATRIVDLGCGNGVLAVAAARTHPSAQLIATDQSTAAVAAAALTAKRAGVSGRVSLHRADGTEAVPENWAELILLNPPFHSGSIVHTGVAHRLIRSCARALAPGGELRLVCNSSLGYRPLMERTIGPVRQLARDRAFTVLSATRR
jgi:16S rRNA (guanine1207-N2)-methyltransferase